MYHTATIRRVRLTNVPVKICIIVHILSVFVALVAQHAKRTIIFHLWPVRQHHIFTHNLIKGTTFVGCVGGGGGKIEYERRVFIFPVTFFFNISHSKKNSVRHYHKLTDLPVTYQLFSSPFKEASIFSTDFWEIFKDQISRKSPHWDPSCSMSADGHSDITKLRVTFGNFSKAPKNKCKLRKWWRPFFKVILPID